MVARRWYYPYGETRAAISTPPTDRLYTGQRWEEGLSLYDYRARCYHPVLGRFISADTLVPEPGNPQSLNRYAYVTNNPLRYADPSGHCVVGGHEMYDDSPACSGVRVRTTHPLLQHGSHRHSPKIFPIQKTEANQRPCIHKASSSPIGMSMCPYGNGW